MTLDHGPQVVRWVHIDHVPLDKVDTDDKPILIAANALGPQRPAHDLIVSPQHRILVGGGRQLADAFRAEALAPAKALTGLRGIRHMNGRHQVTWVHFACDRHEIIIANGCLTETLLLGPTALQNMTPDQRTALDDVFGQVKWAQRCLNGPPARACLTVGAVRRRLHQNQKPTQRGYTVRPAVMA